MKRIFAKLHSERGETLVGILMAILIIALSAALFATMYTASMNINTTARKLDENFYAAVSELEDFAESGNAEESTAMQVEYTPEGEPEEIDGVTGKSVEVDVFTKDGMSAYKSRQSGGTEG